MLINFGVYYDDFEEAYHTTTTKQKQTRERAHLSHEEEVSLLHGAVGLQEVRLEVHIEQVTGNTVSYYR